MSFPDSRFRELRSDGDWRGLEQVPSIGWICGYCNHKIASSYGYDVMLRGQRTTTYCVRICPNCKGPTFFIADGSYAPGSLPGAPVEHVPAELADLHHEARVAASAGAHTAAVLVCRKMLMHIAVDKGAPAGESFHSYVSYLGNEGYIPPGGRAWVDYIRQRGNEANHEILIMSEADSTALITFVEMLLRIIYEFPRRVPSTTTAPPAAQP